jgi:hypothetical protein
METFTYQIGFVYSLTNGKDSTSLTVYLINIPNFVKNTDWIWGNQPL